MHKNLSPHRGFVCALAALLADAVPGVPQVHAAARLSNAALLASQLPDGETLATAPLKDISTAVRSAVAKRPAAAADIVRIAILAKTPKRRSPACGEVDDMVSAGVAAAPSQAREISEMAMAIAPDCADSIAQAIRTPSNSAPGAVSTTGAAVPGSTTGVTGGDTSTTPSSGGDFGAGFGPGFPGSPGFSGSSPSGGFALPTPNPVPTS